MIEQFKNYVSNYDLSNPDIKLKYDHSFRVMELSHKYAIELGLTEEDIKLATEIGLLHDIGRFEQFKTYHTYVDSKSIDHADYSVEQLFDKEKIKKFDNNKRHWEIIRQAIRNHNKYEITAVNDDRCLLHCHLIRDTDKIDILYNWSTLGEIKLREDGLEASPNVLNCIRNKESVKHEYVINKTDRNICFMAFIFDIHFDECIAECYNYIKKQYNKMVYKEPYKEVIKQIDAYVNDRIGIKN